MNSAITVEKIKKSYKKLGVLDGISFDVKKGSIFALLGPNGAGKTTTIKILSTLLLPDSGKATVNGYDVVSQAGLVRASIGLTGQYAAVDEYLTGYENLEMMGRLYRLGLKEARQRSLDLLKEFELTEASKRTVKTYSGGMRRRLDLAMSLISSPPIIFLDEPTTGLDPRSRLTMWEMIEKLAASGTTILLTTQYMEEADRLADKIIVIDGGKVIAEGTADSLKAKVGAERLEIVVSPDSDLDEAHLAVKSEMITIDRETRTMSFTTKGGMRKLGKVLNQLELAKIEVENVSLHKPTLDDVFLTLTGHTANSKNPGKANKKKNGKKK